MTLESTVSQALASCGVHRVFGVPGTQTVPFLDALRRSDIEFMLAAHEGGAAFMANGYARASGRLGVVSTIGGPGFTNALTGVAEAWQDSVPLLHIVNAPKDGPDGGFHLQAIDHAHMVAPITKARFRASRWADATRTVERAVETAMSGEPGPVLLELDLEADRDPGEEPSERDSGVTSAPEPDWTVLRDSWSRAERPLLYLGQGVFDAADLVQEIAERTWVPVLTTPSGRGALPESHPLAMGFDPVRGGVDTANRLLSASDLIVAIGCKLSHNGSAGYRLDFPRDRFVHVDRAVETLGAHYEAMAEIEADARSALEVLRGVERGVSGWAGESLAELRRELNTPAKHQAEPLIAGRHPSVFFDWLRRAVPDETIFVTDSGQHQVMTRRYHSIAGARRMIFPSDFQSMGFGVPAAIGAQMARPERPVVALVGDGGLLMSGLEMIGAARERLPVCFIVFNDGYLNQIRLHQLAQFGWPTGVEIGALYLEGVARGVGVDYVRYDPLSPPELTCLVDGASRPMILDVPVGDTEALRRIVWTRRVKETSRRAIGPKAWKSLKGWLGRWS